MSVIKGTTRADPAAVLPRLSPDGLLGFSYDLLFLPEWTGLLLSILALRSVIWAPSDTRNRGQQTLRFPQCWNTK
jgi:hypothetical protein